MDSDIVWRQDPRIYLKNEAKNLDFLVLSDGRKDNAMNGVVVEGPFNGGVLYGRSNCRSKIAMQTILANIDLIEKFQVTDQCVMVTFF
jgi:hypothetical protein